MILIRKRWGEKREGRIHFTVHARHKMRQYGFSETRVKRVIDSPLRREEAIAPNTIGYMQKAGSPKNPYEIWVMAQSKVQQKSLGRKIMPGKITIISAWKYPGVTKPGDGIPEEILAELKLL